MFRARAAPGTYRALLMPRVLHVPRPTEHWDQPWQVSVPRGDDTSQPSKNMGQL